MHMLNKMKRYKLLHYVAALSAFHGTDHISGTRKMHLLISMYKLHHKNFEHGTSTQNRESKLNLSSQKNLITVNIYFLNNIENSVMLEQIKRGTNLCISGRQNIIWPMKLAHLRCYASYSFISPLFPDDIRTVLHIILFSML